MLTIRKSGITWQATGNKMMIEVEYNGVKAGMFEVRISGASGASSAGAGAGASTGSSGSAGAGDVLQAGNYYLQIYGKYVYPVKAGSTYWLELSKQKTRSAVYREIDRQ